MTCSSGSQLVTWVSSWQFQKQQKHDHNVFALCTDNERLVKCVLKARGTTRKILHDDDVIFTPGSCPSTISDTINLLRIKLHYDVGFGKKKKKAFVSLIKRSARHMLMSICACACNSGRCLQTSILHACDSLGIQRRASETSGCGWCHAESQCWHAWDPLIGKLVSEREREEGIKE